LSILDRQGDERRFAAAGERAVALIESVRGSIDFHTQGPAWSARTSAINGALVSHYLTRYETGGDRADFERALSLLEATRARNLREVRAAGRVDADRAASLRSARELREANQALIGALLLEQTSEPLERRLAKIEERYQLEHAVERRAPIELAVLGGEALRRRLDAHSQARILVAGKTGSHMIVLTREATRVVRLPREQELKALIEASLRELRSRDRTLARSRQLAALLFPADTMDARPSRLIIEADGVFAAVPFSILLDLEAAGQMPPAVTLAPSLSEFFAASASDSRAVTGQRKDLVIFADPAFALSTDADGGSPSAWRAGLARLPYTKIEAQAIAVHFGSDAVLTFDDEQATIANVIAEPARTARVLHIAAHGFGSASDPFLVGLGLANDSRNAASGLLTTHHIGAVRYENELVVVSACESGQGRLLDGEGLMSVARAFLASGAKATLSTLWAVPDQANAEFMKEFYFALTQLAADPAAALVHAQRKMKQSRQFGHPYFWGGFVLHVADGSFRPIPGGREDIAQSHRSL
jgi:CHAT domain-containing protein